MLVTNQYRPDPRVHKEAKALLEGGHKVTVIAWDREHARPMKESVEGVELVRIRTGKVSSMARLLLNYPMFMAKALMAARKMRPNAVHAHDLDTLVIGILIANLHDVPLVYDAHERYAKMIAVDVPPVISRSVQCLEDRIIVRADLVITINDVMAEQLREHATSDVITIMNCIDLPDLSNVKVHDEHRTLVILNAVTFEPMRYIEESIEVISKIDDCILRIAGSGRLQGAVEEAAKKYDNVEYLGFLPHAKMLEEYPRSDVILLLADPRNENYRTGTANKMGEAMAYGIPLIASKGTLSGDIIAAEGCGISIDWSEKNFRDAIMRLRDPGLRNQMGQMGRRAAEREYNWGLMKKRLNERYTRLLDRSTGGSVEEPLT